LLYLFTRISRHDDGSLVHFFSSHFYSALVKDRPSGVKRWTEKKGIDIFQKKFIFIPINKTLHWSQCIVVNPGAIIKHNNELNKWDKVGFVGEGEGFDFDAPFPCIIFLDSLKAHQKAQVAKNVRAWLNAEWKRLGKSDDPALAPFTDSMTVFTPKSKYSYSARPIY
jgi:Ulp1 family protease